MYRLRTAGYGAAMCSRRRCKPSRTNVNTEELDGVRASSCSSPTTICPSLGTVLYQHMDHGRLR